MPQLAEFELRFADGDHDGAARTLVRGVWDALRGWGYLRLAQALLDRLPERVVEPRLNGWCISALASCYAGLGQPNRAMELHERARVISVRTQDAAGEATEIGNLGRCEAELGDVRRAIRLHERALAIFRDLGDREGEHGQLLDLAWCQAELGRPEDVVALLDDVSEPDALALAGAAHRDTGRLGAAIARHEQGVVRARVAGDRRAEAVHAGLLGACHVRTGRIREAAELHRRALELSRTSGDRVGEAVELARLGVCHVMHDELSAALDVCEQALAIARGTADLRTQTDCLSTIGWCFLHLDDPEQARWFCEQAIGLADATGAAGAQAAAHLGMARAHLWAGHPDPADKALRAAVRHRYPPTELEATLISGVIDLSRGDDGTASTHFARAVTLAHAWLRRSRQHIDYAALDICALARAGLTLATSADPAAAIGDFRSARGLCSAAGVITGVEHWLDVLTPADRPDALDEIRPAATGR
jgi:tetratricopeptide (TPR) repeat protein